jgi:integrase
VWHFRRRVPQELTEADPRGEIRVSTGTRDHATALVIATKINAELEAHWQLLADTAAEGRTVENTGDRFDAAVRAARRLGLSYRPASELAKAPVAEIVARLELLEQRGVVQNGAAGSRPLVEASLGGVGKPQLMLSQLFAAFEKLAGDRLIDKSEDQLRKWRNPRLRAIDNLIELIGDKAIAEIDRDDALDFRAWWLDRVRDDGYDQGSANKDLGYMASMMQVIDTAWRLKLSLPFQGVRIAGEKHNPRVPYDPDFVRKRILPGSELGGLNPEARAVVIMVAATGMRPSEVTGLTAGRIVLDAEIPHVQVRAEHRQLKTVHSERDMPLVGRALEVMSEFREGFPRYQDSPDTISATINNGSSGNRVGDFRGVA